MVTNIYTNTQMSHEHPVFEGQISSQKKLKNHANSFSDAIRRCPYPQKKISCCTASSGSARLRHSSDCSKPVHNHFLKKPVLNTFTTCPCQYGSIELNVLKRRMIVVIKKDSKCLSLHRLEQHRRIWLSKKTYRTLVQPADPCGNPFGAFWRNDMKNTQPHLKAGLGISRTHAHSQRNSSIFWLWIRTDFFQ